MYSAKAVGSQESWFAFVCRSAGRISSVPSCQWESIRVVSPKQTWTAK